MKTDSTAGEPWFSEGLRFKCTQCGNCCTGEPGYVWVNDREIKEIAEHLGLDPVEFEQIYVRREGRRRTLREKGNGDCVLYDKKVGCTVYPVRPRQCRSWPFWESNIRTKWTWEATKAMCPGAGKGDFFTVEEILEQSKLIRV